MEAKRDLLLRHAARMAGLPVGITSALVDGLHYWAKMVSVVTRKPKTPAEWLQFVKDAAEYDGDCHTWQSLWIALAGGEGVSLKPSQLNIYHGTCVHLHRLIAAGLAFAEVSDEWIEVKHHVNKLNMSLNNLYRSLGGENNKVRTGAEVPDAEDGGSKGADGRRRLNVGRSMYDCNESTTTWRRPSPAPW